MSESAEAQSVEVADGTDSSVDDASSVTSLWTESPDQGSSEMPETPSWYFDVESPGKGEKPEWLKDKYKTVADQAKAYVDLEKRLGDNPGAPKDGYNFDNVDFLDSSDPMLQHFSETFKEMNMPQQQVEKIFGTYGEAMEAMMLAKQESEFKRMGADGKAQIKQIDSWLNNTFNNDIANTVKSWVATKEDVDALMALRSIQKTDNIPSNFAAEQAASYETLSEVKREKSENFARYKEDSRYRKDIDTRFRSAVVRESAVKR